MRKIRLVRPPYLGLVIQQTDHVAARLVASGQAEYADAPPAAPSVVEELPPIETAEAAPAPETAEGRHAGPRGKAPRGRRRR